MEINEINKFKESLKDLSTELEKLDSTINKWTCDASATTDEDDVTFNSVILQVLTDENDLIAHCRQLHKIFSDDQSTINVNDAESITEMEVKSDKTNRIDKNNKTNRIDKNINDNDIVISTVSLENEYEENTQRFNESYTSSPKSVIYQEFIDYECKDIASPVAGSNQTQNEVSLLQCESDIAPPYTSGICIQNDNINILRKNQHDKSSDYNNYKYTGNKTMAPIFHENDINFIEKQSDCEKMKIDTFNFPLSDNSTSNNESNNIDRSGTSAQPLNTYESTDKDIKQTDDDMCSDPESQSADFITGTRDLENVNVNTFNENNVFSVPNNYEENNKEHENVDKHSIIENNPLAVKTVVNYEFHQVKIQGNAYTQPDYHCDENDDVLSLYDDYDILGCDTPAHHTSTYTHEQELENITSAIIADRQPTDSILETKEHDNVLNENNVSIFNNNDTLPDEFNIHKKHDNDKSKGDIENSTSDESNDDNDMLEMHENIPFEDTGDDKTPAHYKNISASTQEHDRKIPSDVNILSVKHRADSTNSSVHREKANKTKSISSNSIPLQKQPAEISHTSDDMFESGPRSRRYHRATEGIEDIEGARAYKVHVPSKSKNAKITIFYPYCFFYLTMGCTKSKCRFRHEIPTIEDIKAKLIRYNFERFIQEYELMREWPSLKRKYGIYFIEECLSRHLTKELVLMAIDFIKISDKPSEQDLNLNKLAVEAVLKNLNEANLFLCEEQLMTNISPGICLYHVLVEAIADAQNFPTLVPAFIKLTHFISKFHRPISLLCTRKILESVCSMNYDLTLARALIRILRFTSQRIFSIPSMQQFEELTMKDEKLHEYFLSIKKRMTAELLVATEECLNINDQVSSTSHHSATHMKSRDGAQPSIKNTDLTTNKVNKPRASASEDSWPHPSTSAPVVIERQDPTVPSMNRQLYKKAVHKRRKSIRINPWNPKPSNPKDNGNN